MTKVNGMAVTFAMDLKFVAVDKPDGYSRQKAKELLDSYVGTDDNTAITDKSDYPNIIVVMDEAFSDLSVLGGFDTNTDYMPFVHSLEKGNENTITGYLNTSVCGGNTADTEFEFLTGNTMAFLPVGSIPYQQYIKSTTPSLASYLKSIGYATYAQHPYYGSGWNRDTVYPLLGFDNLSFMQDYSNQRFVRKYISDETSFDRIIETYENKPDGQPAFIFNVTMQNHGGYTDTYYGFDNTVTADKLNNSALDQYLSLIKMTDEDLKNLIEYFSNVDEKTIVVFSVIISQMILWRALFLQQTAWTIIIYQVKSLSCAIRCRMLSGQIMILMRLQEKTRALIIWLQTYLKRQVCRQMTIKAFC